MGWLSDKLFGKRKRVNQAALSNAMLPFRDMLQQQQQIGVHFLKCFNHNMNYIKKELK